METYSTQVMELLSLEKVPEGCFQIKVGITHRDRQASYVIDIDEFTYLHLDALQPLNGDRVRLSPYPKWDPYRNTYYCVMVRTSDVSRETLYFACSEEYAAQMQRIRNMEYPSVPSGEDVREDSVGNVSDEVVQPRTRPFSAGVAWMAVWLLIVTGLFVFLPIRFGDMELAGRADSLGGHIDTAKAAPLEFEAVPAAVVPVKTSPLQASTHSTDTPRDFEVIEIDGDQSFFGLPKEYVALTFDDGPSPFTKKIVDILKKQNVAATFLFVGKNVARNPDAVTYANKHGMSIGNHSWDHRLLTKASPMDQAKNMAKASKVIESLTHAPVTLFRPPYGAIDDDLAARAKDQDMKILMWNRDPEDWHAKEADDIIRYFRNIDTSGGVYVLHETKKTVEALPDIIKYLKGKNLKFATFK